MPADLHAHSTASDGTFTPTQLVREAAATGLTAVAITDHDTTAGWPEAVSSLPQGLALVRGAELSCRHAGISLHLLAYLFDPADPALARAMHELRESRVGRAEQMVAALAAGGVPVSWAAVQQLAGGVVGRPHIAQALVAAGVVGSVQEAFGPEWIGTCGRYWTPRHELEVMEALRLVQAAGGVTVFAHPGAAARGRIVGDEVIAAMAAAGLTGIEVDHPDHTAVMRSHLRGVAADLGLVVTGSSDFHGDNKQVALGAYVTPDGDLAALVARATGAPVIQTRPHA